MPGTFVYLIKIVHTIYHITFIPFQHMSVTFLTLWKCFRHFSIQSHNNNILSILLQCQWYFFNFIYPFPISWHLNEMLILLILLKCLHVFLIFSNFCYNFSIVWNFSLFDVIKIMLQNYAIVSDILEVITLFHIMYKLTEL